MKRYLFFSLILFNFVLVLSVESAFACSCALSPTVDIAADQTANIVVMKLRSVEKIAQGDRLVNFSGIRNARLTVEKVYKGGLKVGDELTFAQGSGADCIWTFSDDGVGEEYLFYLGAKPTKLGSWVAGTCSRSSAREFAQADLLYLERISSVRGKTRLSGTLIQFDLSPVEGGEQARRVLPGRKVWITGNGKSIELTTDAGGAYEIYDLPAGRYTVRPEPISGFRSGNPGPHDPLEITLTDGRHAEASFIYSIDNRIAGRVFDTNGTALEKVCVRLRPAHGTDARGLFEMDCTDKAGRFSMEGIPAGTYVLVINEDGKITSTQPFGRFYYPSTKSRTNAAALTIGPGDYFDDLIINAPETADVVKVSGTLVLEDGKRATDKNTEYVTIQFYADPKPGEPRTDREADAITQIDSTGQFTLRILKGQRGRLFATMGTFAGQFVNCPKLDRLIRQLPKNSLPTLRSSDVRIDGTADVEDVVLRFPFPSCQLAHID